MTYASVRSGAWLTTSTIRPALGATATLAITGRFLRTMNACHRACSRRLPACTRATTGGGAPCQRGRTAAPGWPVMPGSVDQQPTRVGVARLVIDPCTREAPEECLLGTSPR